MNEARQNEGVKCGGKAAQGLVMGLVCRDRMEMPQKSDIKQLRGKRPAMK